VKITRWSETTDYTDYIDNGNTGILESDSQAGKPEVDLAACDPCGRLLAGTSPAATICTNDVKKTFGDRN
jgi:hypothetical protein